MSNVMPIPNVTALVARYWMGAERLVREGVERKFHDKDEEFITDLFQGEFRSVVEADAGSGAVEAAFLDDLRGHIREPHRDPDLVRLASGISATVTMHPRTVETKTGGDIGLVLIRPNVGLQYDTLIVDKCYRRGLLCQAKMKRRTHRWGPFSQNQRVVLAGRTDYLSLLLYKYEDGERRALAPFQWQVCAGSTLSDLEQWLKSDAFPSLSDSESIIDQLGSGKIGTENNEIIDELIAPKVRESLVVRIGWPPGEGPPETVFLEQRAFENHFDTVHTRWNKCQGKPSRQAWAGHLQMCPSRHRDKPIGARVSSASMCCWQFGQSKLMLTAAGYFARTKPLSNIYAAGKTISASWPRNKSGP